MKILIFFLVGGSYQPIIKIINEIKQVLFLFIFSNYYYVIVESLGKSCSLDKSKQKCLKYTYKYETVLDKELSILAKTYLKIDIDKELLPDKIDFEKILA